MQATAQGIYATLEDVNGLEQCHFYHTIDLPGHGCIQGQWDLRRGIDSYLGKVDVGGKRVLDMGAATGFLSFHMEKCGADVISYDLSPAFRWDLVPVGGMDWKSALGETAESIRKINNSYSFCHRALDSHARVVHGTVYAIPDAIGTVDVVAMGSILCHLRDPMLALHNAARLAKETVIVADTVPRRKFLLWSAAKALGCFTTRATKAFFRPRLNLLPRSEQKQVRAVWWDVSPELVRQFLGFLGFEETRILYHFQWFHGSPRLLYTVVGRRTRSTPPLAMYQPETAMESAA